MFANKECPEVGKVGEDQGIMGTHCSSRCAIEATPSAAALLEGFVSAVSMNFPRESGKRDRINIFESQLDDRCISLMFRGFTAGTSVCYATRERAGPGVLCEGCGAWDETGFFVIVKRLRRLNALS